MDDIARNGMKEKEWSLNNKYSRFSRIEGGLVPQERSNPSDETKISGANEDKEEENGPCLTEHCQVQIVIVPG